MIPNDPADRDALAGEYVLGLLPEDQVREIERALEHDLDLRNCVAFWEARLAPASGIATPVAPDPALWHRIAADVQPLHPKAEQPLQAPVPPPRPSLIERLWGSALVWRWTAAALTGAVLILALVPFGQPSRESVPRYIAVLQARDQSGTPGWIIQVNADNTVRATPLSRVDPGQGRALQLWTLIDPAKGPVSLGLLPPQGIVRLPRERLPAIGPGQLFEITLEPATGSPIGRPTGQILFIGRAAETVSGNL